VTVPTFSERDGGHALHLQRRARAAVTFCADDLNLTDGKHALPVCSPVLSEVSPPYRLMLQQRINHATGWQGRAAHSVLASLLQRSVPIATVHQEDILPQDGRVAVVGLLHETDSSKRSGSILLKPGALLGSSLFVHKSQVGAASWHVHLLQLACAFNVKYKKRCSHVVYLTTSPPLHEFSRLGELRHRCIVI
jgi:hypothetical protein